MDSHWENGASNGRRYNDDANIEQDFQKFILAEYEPLMHFFKTTN